MGGADIVFADYLKTHPANDRSLAQGLAGDATYLIIKEDKSLESYGLNAVCTHLGCVVPWSAANNKFMCPCHGSQYAPMVMSYVDQLLFHLLLLTVMLLKTTRSFSPLGPKMISVPEERDGGTKYTTVNE